MGFGSYSFSTLKAIRTIGFRTLEKFTTTQIVETGLKVSRLLESYKKNYPEKIPKKAGGGLLYTGTLVNVDDFELAMHLLKANNLAMAKIVKGAKGLPVLTAYVSVLINGAELPPAHLLESALPFAIASLSVEGDVAKLWNQSLQTEIKRLAPLASTGLKFKSGKPKGAIGPVAQAIRARLKTNRSETAKEIWLALSKKPPKGLTFCDNSAGKYVEYEVRNSSAKGGSSKSTLWSALNAKSAGSAQIRLVTTQYERFKNLVVEQRKNIKSITE